MFPLDFTNALDAVQDLQASLTHVVNTGIILVLKLGLLWLIYQLAAAFLPRAFRPLLALGVLALVLAYPAQLNAVGDAAVGALARVGLVPQVRLPDVTSMIGQVQVPQLPEINGLLAQLGL